MDKQMWMFLLSFIFGFIQGTMCDPTVNGSHPQKAVDNSINTEKLNLKKNFW